MPTARVKDAGFVQRHIEKVLLGVGALVLLLAFLIFVAGNPFNIEINGREFASPGAAIEQLELNNDSLEVGLANANPLPETDIPQFDREVLAMLDKPIEAPGELPRLAMGGLTDDAIDPDPVQPPRYALAQPPVPTNIKTVFGTDVLDLELNRPAEEFVELVGERRDPMDISMFIASADFEIWDWAQRLRDPEESAEGGPIPVGIWAQRFGIAGVVLLREEWDPDSKAWVNRTFVEPLPNQPQVLPTSDAPTDQQDAARVVTQLREAQDEIARPELPWLGDFVQAMPPGGMTGEEGLDEDGFAMEDELGPAEKQILQWQEKIELLEEQKRERDERRRPDEDRPSRPNRPRPDSPDFGGADGGGGADRERRDPITRRIERLREQIERLQPKAEEQRKAREERRRERERREALLKERERLLGNIEGERGSGTEADRLAQIGGVRLEEDATVRVWAADLTMRPGKTYRHKLLVAAINPLYAVPRLAPEQMEEHQGKPALLPTQSEIDAMPWSEPVTVEPEVRFFFTSGSDTRARVAIFRRIAGELRKGEFAVEPGDMIGGVIEKDGEELDMRLNAILVDIENRRDLDGTTATMIYLDEQSRLRERSQAEDANNTIRRELEEEIKNGKKPKLRPDEDAEESSPDEFGGPPFGQPF